MLNCQDGVLRVSERISEAPITYDAKHQIILPQRHHVATLLIRHYYEQLGHCGPEHLLARLRKEFWIIKGSSEIKRVIGDCFGCKRRYAQQMTQEMAELPKVRLKPYQSPPPPPPPPPLHQYWSGLFWTFACQTRTWDCEALWMYLCMHDVQSSTPGTSAIARN